MPNSFNTDPTFRSMARRFGLRTARRPEHLRTRRLAPARFRSRSCSRTCCATRTASTVTADDIKGLAAWDPKAEPDREIAFRPSRVLLQDFTGVPADRRSGRHARRHEAAWAATRRRSIRSSRSSWSSTTRSRSTRPARRTPSPTNAELEFQRNRERYAFLRWGQNAFEQLPRRSARYGDRPPGQPRIPGPRGLRRPSEGRHEPAGVSRHPGRHRLAHDDDQRPGRARLGRRRHRGRGGHARPAGLDARSAGRRLQAHRARSAKGRRPPTWC